MDMPIKLVELFTITSNQQLDNAENVENNKFLICFIIAANAI